MDGGLSASDVALMTGNGCRRDDGMFGGEWGAWIILFLIFGMFGFGGWGNGWNKRNAAGLRDSGRSAARF